MQLMVCLSCKTNNLPAAEQVLSTLNSEQLSKVTSLCFPTQRPSLCCSEEYRPPLSQMLGSEQSTLSRTQNKSSSPATGRPSPAEKGSQNHSKISRAIQPCVATSRKEIL